VATADHTRGRRTGRPPGLTGNREAILASARREFFQRAYEGATIRGIAAAAGVDPALIYHYFGSKDRLLIEALRQADPGRPSVDDMLPKLLEDGLEQLGERVIRGMMQIDARAFRTALQSASNSESAAQMVREAFADGGLVRLVRALDRPQEEVRLALVESLITGLVVLRFVLCVEPTASADIESIVAWYGPPLQRLLLEPLS
jgi:AcrR family transcriptional regulator